MSGRPSTSQLITMTGGELVTQSRSEYVQQLDFWENSKWDLGKLR